MMKKGLVGRREGGGKIKDGHYTPGDPSGAGRLPGRLGDNQRGVHGSSESKAALGVSLSAPAIIRILKKTSLFLPGPGAFWKKDVSCQSAP